MAFALHPWGGSAATAAGAGASGSPGQSRRAAADGQAAPASIGPHGDDLGSTQSDPPVRPESGSAAPGGVGSATQPLLPGYEWPIRNGRITNGYGLGRPGSFVRDDQTFHDGIDIASFCGAQITAAHAGTVLVAGRHNEAYIGWIGDLAPMRAKLDTDNGWRGQAIAVVIDDGNGFRSIYAHLGVPTVKHGDVVAAGDVIGFEGASGYATGCHLHYALFNPLETATLTLDPKVARKSKLPPLEVARVDPLLLLPPLADAGITWGWGSH